MSKENSNDDLNRKLMDLMDENFSGPQEPPIDDDYDYDPLADQIDSDAQNEYGGAEGPKEPTIDEVPETDSTPIQKIIDSYVPGPEPRIPASFFQDQEMYVMKACLQSNRRGVDVTLKVAEYLDQQMIEAKTDREAGLLAAGKVLDEKITRIEKLMDPNEPRSPAGMCRALMAQYSEVVFSDLEKKVDKGDQKIESKINEGVGRIEKKIESVTKLEKDLKDSIKLNMDSSEKMRAQIEVLNNAKVPRKPGLLRSIWYWVF